MAIDTKKALKTLNPKSVWLPIIIGLGIVVFIAFRDDKINEDSLWAITKVSVIALVLAALFLVGKDFLNTSRIQLLGSGTFNWKAALRIVFLWEFALAVVPPLIGPIAVVVFIIHKHGVGIGKAVAYAMLLAMLDNFFFITASPIVLYFTGGKALPDSIQVQQELGGSLSYFFYLSYGLACFYLLFMTCALLLFPASINRLLLRVANLKYLKRWKAGLALRAEELFEASREFRGKKLAFWLKMIGLTYLIWIVKFGVLNMIISGFSPIQPDEHLLLVGRHLIMWVVMLVSPTPGSAGTAEYIFPAFFEEFLGEYTFGASLIWRLLSFYPYLIIGALILPGWVRRIFGKRTN